MANDIVPETWSEKCKISIQEEGTGKTNYQYEAITDTVDIDEGEKGIEAIPNTKGGRLVKFLPEEMSTVTFEAYPIYAGSATATSATVAGGFDDMLHPTTGTYAEPLDIENNTLRKRFRVAILWTNDLENASAHTAVAAGSYAFRWIGCGFITSAKKSFTDGVLKFTVEFKIPTFVKLGTSNIKKQSTPTNALTLLATFSNTANW